jgi:hypothetical protein
MDGSAPIDALAYQFSQAASSKVASKASTSKQILPWETRPSAHANQSDAYVVCTTEGEYIIICRRNHF